jgi:SNF2 family DNA or RNA helicase
MTTTSDALMKAIKRKSMRNRRNIPSAQPSDDKNIEQYGRPILLLMNEIKMKQSLALVYHSPIASALDSLENKAYNFQHYLSLQPLEPLWSFQESAIQFIIQREADVDALGCRGGLLCDQMGLGKSKTMLSVILQQNQARCRETRRRFNDGPTLIVCDEILIDNWLNEFSKFPERTFEYFILTTSRHDDAALDKFYFVNCCDVVLTTYATLTTGKWREIFNGIVWRRVVCDEAHKFVNKKTAFAQSVFDLQAISKWGLSGTPRQNHLSDILTLLNYIGVNDIALLSRVMLMRQKSDILALKKDHDILPEFRPVNRRVRLVQFRTDAERVLYYLYAKFALETKKISSFELKRGNTPIIIHTMRQLCINPLLVKNIVLPSGMLTIGDAAAAHNNNNDALRQFVEKQSKSFRLDYSIGENHRKVNDEIYQEDEEEFKSLEWQPFVSFSDEEEAQHYQLIFDELKKTPGRWQVTEAMTAVPLEKTKQILTHIMHRTLRYDVMSSKEADIVQCIRETPVNDQIIIYSFYVEVLERLKQCIVTSGFNAVVVTGKTKKTNKSSMNQFESDSNIKVLLMTLKVGSQGLNMINANYVFFVDPWWCPFPMEQAEFRIQRHGQWKDVFIVYFIMDHTIEVCIMNHTIRKKQMLNLFDNDQSDVVVDEKSGLFDYKIDIVSLS